MGLKNSSAGAGIGIDTTVINIFDNDKETRDDTQGEGDDAPPPSPDKTESLDEVEPGNKSGGGGVIGLMINLIMGLLLVWPGYRRYM